MTEGAPLTLVEPSGCLFPGCVEHDDENGSHWGETLDGRGWSIEPMHDGGVHGWRYYIDVTDEPMSAVETLGLSLALGELAK